MPLALAGWLLLTCLLVSPLSARVVRVEVHDREPVLKGRAFGLAGAYEKLAGKIFFSVDPSNSANRIVTDMEYAPTNPAGQVEFSADFYLLKPREIARGNGALLLGIPNRGRKLSLRHFNLAPGSSDPQNEADFGDGFLLREGYTLAWIGWQFDPPRRQGLMRLYPPTARQGELPIRGLVRSDFVVQQREYDHLLSDRQHIAYPVADPGAPENVLTVREGVEAPRHTIPRSQWEFARLRDGKPIADRTRVYLQGGFEPGKIYEAVYVSEGPPLVGLGPAAVRDLASFLKYESSDALSIPEGAINRALGFGVSQCGRFLRTFLYHGFNGDEAGRRVFDGVIAHVAGAGRGSFNHRFAQPSRDAHPYMNFFYPTDIFPFTDVEQIDPETRVSDGILTHNMKPEFMPKVFYSNSSYEYWGRAASLIHTTADGKRDAPLMENVRIYLFAGSQHGPAAFPPEITIGQQRDNPLDFRWSLRALLKALDRWVDEGELPPASRYPRLDEGSLVPPEKLGFPQIPGVNFSSRVHRAYRADYGPRFADKGIVSRQPPKIGSAFPILVPAVDSDGNETAGIKLPELAAPLATYTGWNLFDAHSGPSGEVSSMAGSYIPFPPTKAERGRTSDPRPSIEERYESREQHLGLVSNAALELIEQGYLLGEDLPAILRNARRHWDDLMQRWTPAP